MLECGFGCCCGEQRRDSASAPGVLLLIIEQNVNERAPLQRASRFAPPPLGLLAYACLSDGCAAPRRPSPLFPLHESLEILERKRPQSSAKARK